MKIILIMILNISLFAGTLRILNIPKYSKIMIDNNEEMVYENNTKRSLDIELKNTLVGSYDILIENKYFLPVEFSADISDRVFVKTLDMRYANEFFTNIQVEDVDGNIDDCMAFQCSASAGERLYVNVYKFKNNIEDINVDFSVSKDEYYDETDSYDVDKNQKIIISPVSSWGLFGIGAVSGIYPANEELELSDGDDYIKYFLDDTVVTGAKLFYKKNTFINVFIGFELNYLVAKETHDEEDEDLTDDKNFDGTPSITVMTAGASLGYRYRRLFVEAGVRQEMVDIEKTYSDRSFAYDESRVAPYVSLNYLFWKIGHGGMSIGVTSSSEKITTASLQIVF
ncbi:MAG: hypothetical protein U9O56_06990 [Campylobacterota bacterium]|nr:hypothetical protein [Campylobacterota bacterium]